MIVGVCVRVRVKHGGRRQVCECQHWHLDVRKPVVIALRFRRFRVDAGQDVEWWNVVSREVDPPVRVYGVRWYGLHEVFTQEIRVVFLGPAVAGPERDISAVRAFDLGFRESIPRHLEGFLKVGGFIWTSLSVRRDETRKSEAVSREGVGSECPDGKIEWWPVELDERDVLELFPQGFGHHRHSMARDADRVSGACP